MAGVGRLLLLTPLPGFARLPVGHPVRAASLRHQGPRRAMSGSAAKWLRPRQLAAGGNPSYETGRLALRDGPFCVALWPVLASRTGIPCPWAVLCAGSSHLLPPCASDAPVRASVPVCRPPSPPLLPCVAPHPAMSSALASIRVAVVVMCLIAVCGFCRLQS